MIDPDRDSRAFFERLGRGLVELEAQEMHRRGFLPVLPIEILVGNRPDPLVARDSEPHLVLDADQICEPLRAFVRIRVLDHHGRLQIAAVRNERVVSGELLPDTLFLEDPLDAQHFLHLVTDGELVLEDKSDVLAEVSRAVLLVRNDLRPELRALARVGFEVMRLARSILGMASIVIQTGSNSVGLPKQRQGVRLDCPGLAHALLYMAGGDRAVRADVVGSLPAICRNTGRPIFMEFS